VNGAASLRVTDRARSRTCRLSTAPHGLLSTGRETGLYLKATAARKTYDAVRIIFKPGMFGIPRKGECDYSTVLELDLATVRPERAGPKRPQDRMLC